MHIRAVRSEEFPVLQDIEVKASLAFHDLGMTAVADDEPFSIEELTRFADTGLAWVAVDAGRPVAYLVAEHVDGRLHIEQVSVHPDAAHRGIGRSLIEYAARHARDAGVPALTLTTFTDVPWNAPYYERLGFRRMTDAELTPGLREIRRREAAAGLDRWPRVCMMR